MLEEAVAPPLQFSRRIRVRVWVRCSKARTVLLAACEQDVDLLWEGQPLVTEVRRQCRPDVLHQGLDDVVSAISVASGVAAN